MTIYLTGRCPLCKRTTLHLTAVGIARMERRGFCEMCQREEFLRPLYHLACMEQSLLNVTTWDAEKPGPVPIAARAHQLPQDARNGLRTIYKKRERQAHDLRAALLKAGAPVRREVEVPA